MDTGRTRDDNPNMLEGLLHVSKAPLMNSFAKKVVRTIDEIDEAINKIEYVNKN